MPSAMLSGIIDSFSFCRCVMSLDGITRVSPVISLSSTLWPSPSRKPVYVCWSLVVMIQGSYPNAIAALGFSTESSRASRPSFEAIALSDGPMFPPCPPCS